MSDTTDIKFKRLSPGVYETEDSRWYITRREDGKWLAYRQEMGTEVLDPIDTLREAKNAVSITYR